MSTDKIKDLLGFEMPFSFNEETANEIAKKLEVSDPIIFQPTSDYWKIQTTTVALMISRNKVRLWLRGDWLKEVNGEKRIYNSINLIFPILDNQLDIRSLKEHYKAFQGLAQNKKPLPVHIMDRVIEKCDYVKPSIWTGLNYRFL